MLDNTASTNRFVDSNCIQRLHHVPSCSMTLQWAATTPHTSAPDLYSTYTVSLPYLPPSLRLPPRRVSIHLSHFLSFFFPCIIFSPCNTIRLAAGSDNVWFSLKRYPHSYLLVLFSYQPKTITLLANMAPAANIHILPATLAIRQQNNQDVPSCAKSCLDHFKSTGYSCDSDDLSCLCSQYSAQGLTLGELAYACSQTNCNQPPPEQNRALYNICSDQRDVVVATNSNVLTLPSYTTSSISSEETMASSAIPSQSASETSTSAVNSNPTPATSHTQATATGLPPMPVDEPTGQATNLTTAQSVGISIAAMGGLCLAGALIYLLVWCKRRRAFKSPKSRKDSFDFIDKGAPRHSPFRHGHADPRGPLGGFAQTRVELGNGGGVIESNWRAQQRKLYPELHSQSHRSISPESKSHDSLRTVSQLLPEKAGQTPPQPPYKSPRAPSVFSTTTIFEEDGKTPKLLSPATMFPMPVAPKPVLRSVPGRPARPDQPAYSSIFTASPVEMRNPQSLASSPSKSVRKQLTPAPLKNIAPPPPVPQKPFAAAGRPLSTEFRVSTHQGLRPPSSVPSYMPDYYTSNDSRSPAFDMITPPRRRPLPPPCPPAKSNHPPRSYRCSGGSETSFESNDPDEVTPPEEIDRHLSPVPEGDSPTQNVRYPKVPRSSNQAVPRSPQPTPSPSYCHSKVWPLSNELHTPPQTPPNPKTPSNKHQHQHSLSGSTLAAKRLGPSAATSLSAGLHIKSNSNPQASPLKGYGRPANSSNNNNTFASQQRKPSYAGTGYGPDPSMEPRTPEMTARGSKIVTTDREVVLRSPLWERKLTPTRRGDDLFLSVSLASPGLAPGAGGAGMGRGAVDSRWR